MLDNDIRLRTTGIDCKSTQTFCPVLVRQREETFFFWLQWKVKRSVLVWGTVSSNLVHVMQINWWTLVVLKSVHLVWSVIIVMVTGNVHIHCLHCKKITPISEPGSLNISTIYHSYNWSCNVLTNAFMESGLVRNSDTCCSLAGLREVWKCVLGPPAPLHDR